MRPVYLDHAATTPMHPAAIEAMAGALAMVGNASSLHTSGRAARRRMEEARETLAGLLGARPSEIVFTAGGTESDNLAVKGIYWARRDTDPRRRRIVTTPIEHHAVLDAVQWLVEHEGADVTWLPVGPDGSVTPSALREALHDHDDVACASIMWANNEVGTILPIAELAAVAAEFDVPMHSDAVQVVGQLPVDFAATGLSALSITAHKFGGPTGVGALLLRRDTACVPLLHGGGQERDVRSGTPDVAGAVAMAAAAKVAIEGLEGHTNPCLGLARRAHRGCGLLDRRRRRQRRRRGIPVARQHALHLPWLRGRLVVDAVGRQRDRMLDWVGLYGRRRAAVPRPHRDGRGSGHRAGFAATFPGAQQHRRRRRGGAGGVARCRRACPAGCAGQRGAGEVDMRVLVAMSGGVDSSVAAARMVDAGHDVVGVHLALSSAPGTLRTGSRGCCSKEDAGDARRVADVLGIPFYIWDFADRFAEDVIDDFVASYARGETPNPCVRCNERIKFSALAARAVALGFDVLATGHYARLSHGRLRRAVDPDKDQSYVLGVLTAEQLARAAFPIGDTAKPEIREEAARRGLAVAEKPDSHDICFIPSGDTRAFLGSRIGVRRGAVVDAAGAVLAEHDGVHGFTIGQRKGLGIPGPGPDGQPRYVTAIDAETGTVRVGDAGDLEVFGLTGERPVFTSGSAFGGPVECDVQVRAHGGVAHAVADLRDGSLVAQLRSPLRGVAPGQTMVLYRPDPDGDEVIASATIAAAAR